jgi:hypothetical protein
MSDDLVQWEWDYCNLVGYEHKGGLQRMIDWHIKQGWELVERRPPSNGDDGSCIMRRKFLTGTITTQMKFNLGDDNKFLTGNQLEKGHTKDGIWFPED